MSRIRDLRLQARGDLHREMSVPAFYIPVPGADPISCSVRPWRKKLFPSTGEENAGQMVISEDRIRLYLPDLPATLRINAVVSVETGEAYRLDHFYPADGDFQTARVVILSAAEADGLPVPSGDG